MINLNLFMFKFLKILGISVVALLVLFFVATWIFYLVKSPSNDRNWEFGQQKLQQVVFDQDQVLVKDLRDYQWTDIGNEEYYRDFEFDLKDIVGLEVGESHFSVHEGIGHIFLIFNLKDGQDVALSIEARRNDGEDFGILKGLIFDYELIYILATKRDLLSLREQREERIYIYPMKATPEVAQKLFGLIAKRVNSLYQKPEFYHLLFRNCTNLITDEVEKISEHRFPFYEKTFAPGHAGRALFKMGVIDGANADDFSEIRDQYRVKY